MLKKLSAAQQQLLASKIVEMQGNFTRWARNKRLLRSGDRAVLKVFILSELSLSKMAGTVRTKVSGLRETCCLNFRDWKTVFSLDWSSVPRRILETLHERGNAPITKEEFMALTGMKWTKQTTMEIGRQLADFGKALQGKPYYYVFGPIPNAPANSNLYNIQKRVYK